MGPAYDADSAQAIPTIEARLQLSSMYTFASPDDVWLRRIGSASRS